MSRYKSNDGILHHGIIRHSGIIRILALLILSALFLSSCSQPYDETFPVTSESKIENGSDYYDQLDRGESGPLRLFWTNRHNLNPVKDQTYTGKAAYQLVYNSLVSYQNDGSMRYDLAEKIQWMGTGGSSLLIKIKENIRFHDGSELTAADIAQILAYLWSENGGPEFQPEIYASDDQLPDDAVIESDSEDEESEDEDDQSGDIGNNEEQAEENINENDNEKETAAVYPQAKTIEELFDGLQEIKVINKSNLKCTFNKPSTGFTAILDVPIIPAAAWLDDDPWQIIPGTGRYKILSFTETGELVLAAHNETKSGPEKIIIKQYYNDNEAMKALEEDKLDVVLLSPDKYALYHNRNNLDLIRFTGSSSIFLAANTVSGIMSATDELLRLKKILQSGNLQRLNYNWPGELTDIPLSNNFFMLDHNKLDIGKYVGQAEKVNYSDGPADIPLNNEITKEIEDLPSGIEDTVSGDNEIETSVLDERKIIEMIVPETDHLADAASKLENILDRYYKVEVELLSIDEYSQALRLKDYDLALCASEIPVPENPAWLFGPDGSVKGMDVLDQSGINHYNTTRLSLNEYNEIWYKPNETDRIEFTDQKGEFSELLIEVAAYSPFIHLYLPFSALAYGDRVKGQSDPGKYEPYNNIEELWIWSGQ